MRTHNGKTLLSIWLVLALPAQAASLAPTGGEPEIYLCQGGTKLIVRHYGNNPDRLLSFVKLKLPSGQQYTLPNLMAAGGVRYTDERTLVWWEKGDAFLDTLDGKGVRHPKYGGCRAQDQAPRHASRREALHFTSSGPFDYLCDSGSKLVVRHFQLSDKSIEFAEVLLPGGLNYTGPKVGPVSDTRYELTGQNSKPYDPWILEWRLTGGTGALTPTDPDAQEWTKRFRDCKQTRPK